MKREVAAIRRWFRLSLRSGLILITLISCFLGWVAKERRQSAYERFFGATCEFAEYAGPCDSLELSRRRAPQGWWADLTRRVLGERIRSLAVRTPDQMRTAATLQNLDELSVQFEAGREVSSVAQLNNLKMLVIRSDFVGDLSFIADLKALNHLVIKSDSITDLSPISQNLELKELILNGQCLQDVRPLSGLKNLRWLSLNCPALTDLSPLFALKNLQQVTVNSDCVTDEQLESTREVLSNCLISR